MYSIDRHAQVRLLISSFTLLDRDWHGRTACDPYWRLYCNDAPGAALMEPNENREIPMDPGVLYVVPAWHTFRRRLTRRCGHCFLHFDLLGISRALVERYFGRIFRLTPDPAISAVLPHWLSAVQQGGGTRLATVCHAKALIQLVLAQLLLQLDPAQKEAFEKATRLNHELAPLLQFIENHLHETLCNEDLATRCGMGRDTFIRTFKRLMDTTPAQYILDRRISHAAMLLAYSDLTIDHIAENAGFADRHHLSRQFRRRMGLPPAAYRRMRE